MTDPDQDEVFEAYLQRRPVLPPLDDKLEPPVALDQKVLAAARQAIGPQRAGVGGRTDGHVKQQANRAPRWAVPIALAATILLSLSVVINISLNTQRTDPNRERMAAAARADLKASGKENAIAEFDVAGGGPANAKSPAMAFNDDERRESASGEISSNEVVLPGAKLAGVAKPRAPVEAEPAEPAAPAPAAAAPAPELAAAPADTRVARSASAADKAAYFAKRAGVTPQSAAPPSAASRSAAPSALVDANTASLASASSQAAVADEVAPHPTDPKVWLRQIEALRAAGKAEQAATEMRRFRAAFPGYTVPPVPAAPSDLPK